MAATTVVPTRFTAKDDFSKVVKRMTKEIKSFGRQGVHAMNRFDAKVNKTFGKLRKTLGGVGTLFGGIALFSVLSSGIGVIADFEQANANLASVMSNATNPQLIALQENAEYLGGVTAKTATEVVGLQESLARLGFDPSQILNMTSAVISGSIAMRGELSETASLVGAVVRTFDKFSSIDTSDIVDKMTLSTQKTALDFGKLQTALPIVAGAANAAGIDFDTLLGLLGKLSDAGIDASMSSNALKNIFIQSKAKGLQYGDILDLISKSSDKLTASVDSFGVRASVSGAILANKLKDTSKLIKEIKKDFKGAAAEAERIQLNTLTGKITLLSSAYDKFILSLDNGTGAFSNQAKSIVMVATDMLSLLSNTAKSTEALTDQEKVIRGYAETGLRFVSVLKAVVQGYIAFKVITTIIRAVAIVQAAYNAVLVWYSAVAVTAALTGASFAAVIWATLWPILAVIAAVALIVIAFKNWGKISEWVEDKIKNIIKWFKAFDFVDMFKKIGKVIIDFLLFPLKSVLFVLSKIPGTIGDLASSGLDTINDITGKLTVNDGTSPKSPISTPENQSAESIQKSITQNFLSIDIKDNGGNVESTEMTGGNNIPIMLESTLAF